jgi:hypothetical protein
MAAERRLDLLAARQASLGEVGSRAAAVDTNPKAAPLAHARRIPNDDVAGRSGSIASGLGQALVSGRVSLSHRSLLSSG